MIPWHAYADDWSTADTWRESAFQVLNLVDLGQTLNIVNRSDLYEQNPVLGKHPKKKKVYTYFIAGGFAHYGISRFLTPKNRQIWQYVTIGFGVGTVWRNYTIGVNIDF